jgi:predicted Zn-dependent protease
MATQWVGHFLDGRTAARQRVAIRLMRSGLEITTEKGATLWWPYAQIRQTQGFYTGEEVRLEKGGEIAEVLLVSDATFLSELHRIAPEVATRFHNPTRRRMRVKLTVLAAVAVVGLTIGLYFWGIPAMAGLAASGVPVSWEEQLGQSVVDELAPLEDQCTDPDRRQAIEEIMTTLTSALPHSPYTFQVLVVDDPTVNAFAAPGGYIVVFRGLLEQTETPEELAGVLAHEMQHIEKRHATRMLIQHASTGLLIAALTGGGSDASVWGLEGARTLGILRYSRHHEEEADAEGLRQLVAANVDPNGMITFFESLKEQEKGMPEFLRYVSTHPTAVDRIQRLQSMAEHVEGNFVELLPDYDWKDVNKICEVKGT